MRLWRRTRFRTVVLTKQKLVLGSVCFALGFLAILLVLLGRNLPDKYQSLAFSDEFYKAAIGIELDQEQDWITFDQVIEHVLGFDISDGASILKKSLHIKTTPKPSETPTPTASPTPIPPEEHIEEVHIKKGPGIALSNQTTISVDPEALAQQELLYSVTEEDAPQVLIVHTHTTECFSDSGQNKYQTTDTNRNTDESVNIVAVGAAIQKVLEENGIKTVHDTTVHDYPSFNGAYNRSLATMRNNLEAYPSVKVILDVHRDGLVREDGSKLKVVTEIGGKKTAQCMFVVGSNANLTHDHWLENLKLACKLQQEAQTLYPGLMRPINIREERFNQQVCMGSLILEVGSNGNTLEEAIRGGEAMAEVLAKVLKK